MSMDESREPLKREPLNYAATYRWLRRELTSIRTGLGWSRHKTAEIATLSLRTIERIETGPTPISPANLALLCDVYKVAEHKRGELRAMLAQASQTGWWDDFADVLPPVYAEHCELETLASDIYLFAPLVHHGLVQSPQYAEWVQTVSPEHSRGTAAERYVSLRQARSHRILQSRQNIRYLIDESIVRRGRRGEPVDEQLAYLVDLDDRGVVEVRVLPEDEPLLIPSTSTLLKVGQRRVACFGGFIEAHTENAEKVTIHADFFGRSWQRAQPLQVRMKEWAL